MAIQTAKEDTTTNRILGSKDEQDNRTTENSNAERSDVRTEIIHDSQLTDAYRKAYDANLSDKSTIVAIINHAHVTDMDGLHPGQAIVKTPVIDWSSIDMNDDFGDRFEPPFMIVNDTPRLFELLPTLNASQQPNYNIKMLTSQFSGVDTIVKASEIFNASTLTVRSFLRKQVNNKSISSPNVYDQGTLKVGKIGSGSVSMSSKVYGAESRLTSMIDIFMAFDGKLYSFPSKIIPERRCDNALTNLLTSMPIYEQMYPHIYYSVFSFPASWYREQLVRLMGDAPIFIGDQDVSIISSIKSTAYISTITDQFAAELARLNFSRMRDSQSPPDQLQSRYAANSFRDTSVNVTSDGKVDFLSIYQPIVNESRSFMYHLLISKERRTEISQQLMTILENIKLFDTADITTTIDWVSLPNTGNMDQTKDLVKTSLMNAANMSFEKYIIFETFSNFFEFDFSVENSPTPGLSIVILMAIITMAKTFPNIFQKSMRSVGYVAMVAFESLFPNEFREFVNDFGFIVDSKNNRSSLVRSVMTPDQLVSGCVYSIFHKKTYGNKYRKLSDLITEFRSLCVPNRQPYRLTRKENAGYPYMSMDYMSQTSWPELDVDNVKGGVHTSWSNNLSLSAGFGLKMLAARYGNTVAASSPTTPKNLLTSLFNRMQINLSTAASLYQFSARRVQETLKESFAFVYDEFSDVKLSNFEYPAPLVMSSKENNQIIYIKPIKVTGLNIFSALRFALTTSGIFERNISVTSLDPHGPAETPIETIRDGYIQGHLLDKMYISTVMKARKMNIALWIISSLRKPMDDENPLKSFAIEFADYLSVNNWIPLAKKVFKTLGLDWEEYFSLGSLGPDTRSLSRTLFRLSRVGLQPDTDNVSEGELLGKDLISMNPYDLECFKVISKMFFEKREGSKTTSVIPKSTGFVLGRFYVEDMTDGTSIRPGWERISKDKWSISKQTVSGMVGLKPVLKIERDSGTSEYSLPNIYQPVQLLLETDWAYDIPIEYRSTLSRAIYQGKIAFLFKKQEVVCESLIDVADRKEDVSESITITDIDNILSLPAQAILQWDFISTYYATNYTINYDIQSSYIQWIIPVENINGNLFAAALTYAEKHERTALPTKEMIEFGKLGNDHSNLTSSGDPKIDLGLVNWNNTFPVLNEKMFKVDVEVAYAPRIDYLM